MNLKQRHIEGFCFDLDNTLIDRQQAMHRYLGRYWPPPSEEALTNWLALDDWGYAPRQEVCEAIAQAHQETADMVWAHMKTHLGQCVEPDPARLDLLSTLKATYPCVIVTNGSVHNQSNKWRHAHLDRIFTREELIISEDVGAKKPHQEIFERACKHLNLAPDQVLMVGDHAMQDCMGAMNYGMQAAWVTLGRKYPATLPLPLAQIESLNVWLSQRLAEDKA